MSIPLFILPRARVSLLLAEDGTVFSLGSDTNFCLGHGEQHNELHPRAIQSLKRKGVHAVRVSAGDEHVVALDSNGQVRANAISKRVFKKKYTIMLMLLT